jgi:hypothetical protein
MNLFANGSDHKLTLDAARSFFKVGRFPPNFYRRPKPFTLHEVGLGIQEIMGPYPVPTGYNKYGRFVFTSISSTTVSFSAFHTLYNRQLAFQDGKCDLLAQLLSIVPVSLYTNSSCLLHDNVKTLVEAMHLPFPGYCPRGLPGGPSGL